MGISNSFYSCENYLVWSETIKSREVFYKKYSDYIYKPYLDGFNNLGFVADDLPTNESLAKSLSYIGWKPVFVEGYLPTKMYINYLSKRQIPISLQMRSLEHVNYALAPDFVHDLIGHLPMLFCEEYVEYLLDICKYFSFVEPSFYDRKLFEAQSKLSSIEPSVFNDKKINLAKNELRDAENELRKNPSFHYKLSKLFLWTIEFGLIKCGSKTKIFGAGLMSSLLEAQAIFEGKIEIKQFSLDKITRDFNFSDLQEQVFVIDSFKSIRKNLSALRNEHL